MDKYGDKARDKLKVALTCVKNAERTLTDFLDFLKTDKYKEWNEEQKAKRNKPRKKKNKNFDSDDRFLDEILAQDERKRVKQREAK